MLPQDSKHTIRLHGILVFGLIPCECSAINALSTTFALKGKASVLHNFSHLFFFFSPPIEVIIAESKIKTSASL